MENNCKCSISYPHSHLVHGKTFDCERGNGDIPMIGMASSMGFNTVTGYGKITTAGIPKAEGHGTIPFVVIV